MTVVIISIYLGLMIAAAYLDWRDRIVPNAISLIVLTLWIVYIDETDASMSVVVSSLGLALIVFAFGALLFSLKVLGGGDVKLASLAMLWAGLEGSQILGVAFILSFMLLNVLSCSKNGREILNYRCNPNKGVPAVIALAFAALVEKLLV